jgi:EpsI family protein
VTLRLVVVIVILAVTNAGAAWFSRPEAHIARVPLAALPTAIADWKSSELPLDPKVLRTLGVDDHLSRVYQRRQAPPASVYIGFYRTQRTGETIHSPLKCLPGTGWQPVETGRRTIDVTGASGNSERILVNRYVVQKGIERHVVVFWYQMRGHVVASEYTAKLYLMDGALRTNRTDGALVRIIVPLRRGDTDASADEALSGFVRLLYPMLSAHLPA